MRFPSRLVLLFGMAVTISPVRGQPANDLCETPTVLQMDELGVVSVDFDTAGATTPDPPPVNCAFTSNQTLHNDIWFEVHTLCGGTLQIILTADFDAFLTAYAFLGPAMTCPPLDDAMLLCDHGGNQQHFLAPFGPNERIQFRISSRAEGIHGTGSFVAIEEHFCSFDDDCAGGADPTCAIARCNVCLGCSFEPVNTGSRCGDDPDVCTTGYCESGTCEAVETIYGDVNKDGIVDLSDILCVLDGFAGGFERCTFNDVDIADCQRDGIIDLRDILAVLDAFEGVAACCANRR